MCLNPIRIPANRLDYRKGLHRPYNVVACGKCADCIEERKSNYAVRASFEMQKYVGDDGKKGGCGIFLLFTYNPEHRPYFEGTQQACFNRQHISTLIKSLKDHYTPLEQSFSYMIGAEYGVDPTHGQYPHYHGLFMLDENINPIEFAERCRMIWTGQRYIVRHQGRKDILVPWKFGNLGFMFPNKLEVSLGEHLCKDHGACATYAAKYAVKQVGFYNKPLLKENCNNKTWIHLHRNELPRVWINQKFGFNMMDEPSFNLVDNTVFSPLKGRTVMIPRYIALCAMYVSKWRGTYKEVPTIEFDKELWNDKLQDLSLLDKSPNQYELSFYMRQCCKEVSCKRTRVYERELTTDGMLIKFKRIWKQTHDISFTYRQQQFALYDALYYDMPLGVLGLQEGNITCLSDMFTYHTASSVYINGLVRDNKEYDEYCDDGFFTGHYMNEFMQDFAPQWWSEYTNWRAQNEIKEKMRHESRRAYLLDKDNSEKLSNIVNPESKRWKL